MTTEVRVTGLAWSTALGADRDGVWRALLAGESGIRPVPGEPGLRNDRAAAVPGLDDTEPSERQHILARDTIAAALADAGVTPGHPLLYAVLGTSYGAHLDDSAGEPLDAWCHRVADDLGLVRAPLSLSTACSSGSDSLLAGAELIRTGVADLVVCGAADVLTTAKRRGHSLLGTMSPTTLRSFDADRDGTILGEGAGFLVLESVESARARGARSYGRLIGAGSANDATGATTPDPSGDTVVRAVERALAAAGRTVADVSTINAHASGTRVNDDVESRSLARIFTAGEPATIGTVAAAPSVSTVAAAPLVSTVAAAPLVSTVAAAPLVSTGGAAPLVSTGGAAPLVSTGGAAPTVFATKGALGHSLGATGAVEAIAVLLALRDRTVPPVAGLRRVMPGFPLPLPGATAPAPIGPGIGLSITLGFGGFNTCLAFDTEGAGRPAREGARDAVIAGRGTGGADRDAASGDPVAVVADEAPAVIGRGVGTATWDGAGRIPAAVPARYADPVAWLVADAVGAALRDGAGEALTEPDEVGHILVSAHCTRDTILAVAAAVADGRLSPMRFAAASPGTAGSISCIVHGFRGPTLTFATTPRTGGEAARAVAHGWLASGAARHVVLTGHTVDGTGRHTVHSEILGPADVAR
ncbi:beta-ketoacyl synthase N-terminal-like domain-containing protein [Actinoplanes sp. G11-F43]|uniref:beta-ketoacyl synthase N-terminal-like domain-containing protein n=1 Tax=Actinoplanes sp. G11-F43 TaxID=3424130 RepID=UPI003D33AEA9